MRGQVHRLGVFVADIAGGQPASADMWDSSADSEATPSPGCTPAIDYRRRFGRAVVGVSEYQGQLAAVIAVDEKADQDFDGYATSFWVSPRDITSETLERLWLHDTDATVMTIRLTAAGGRAEVSAWVRYHSEKRLGKDVWAGLNPLTGRQLSAVRALPAPAKRPPLVVLARALRDHEQLAVRVGPTEVGAAPQDSMRPAKDDM